MSIKQIIELSVLMFCLYLGIFFIIITGREYYEAFGLITLLFSLGVYVLYSQKNCKFSKYLRIFLYIILGLTICGFISQNFGYSSSYSVYTRLLGLTPFQALSTILIDFYPIYILLILATLLFNKQLKSKIFKIGKLRINL